MYWWLEAEHFLCLCNTENTRCSHKVMQHNFWSGLQERLPFSSPRRGMFSQLISTFHWCMLLNWNCSAAKRCKLKNNNNKILPSNYGESGTHRKNVSLFSQNDLTNYRPGGQQSQVTLYLLTGIVTHTSELTSVELSYCRFVFLCRLKTKRLIVVLRAVIGNCKQRFIKCDFKGLDGVICFQSKHCVSVSLLIGPDWPYTWPEKQSKHPVDFKLFFSHLFNSARLASVSILWQH